ncbi:hypothetical protein L210DRAFT_3512871 [Boletus edulis BED1]|uniref:Uncharacterized protein n=1 Tax=Boletus edulis BED1 TaxID=1328754 RepID=A0AAD4G4T3_BOLED|nr:hypothetical protein L210DRAFT_3512871 [Boletus edulis BED1]
MRQERLTDETKGLITEFVLVEMMRWIAWTVGFGESTGRRTDEGVGYRKGNLELDGGNLANGTGKSESGVWAHCGTRLVGKLVERGTVQHVERQRETQTGTREKVWAHGQGMTGRHEMDTRKGWVVAEGASGKDLLRSRENMFIGWEQGAGTAQDDRYHYLDIQHDYGLTRGLAQLGCRRAERVYLRRVGQGCEGRSTPQVTGRDSGSTIESRRWMKRQGGEADVCSMEHGTVLAMTRMKYKVMNMRFSAFPGYLEMRTMTMMDTHGTVRFPAFPGYHEMRTMTMMDTHGTVRFPAFPGHHEMRENDDDVHIAYLSRVVESIYYELSSGGSWNVQLDVIYTMYNVIMGHPEMRKTIFTATLLASPTATNCHTPFSAFRCTTKMRDRTQHRRSADRNGWQGYGN